MLATPSKFIKFSTNLRWSNALLFLWQIFEVGRFFFVWVYFTFLLWRWRNSLLCSFWAIWIGDSSRICLISTLPRLLDLCKSHKFIVNVCWSLFMFIIHLLDSHYVVLSWMVLSCVLANICWWAIDRACKAIRGWEWKHWIFILMDTRSRRKQEAWILRRIHRSLNIMIRRVTRSSLMIYSCISFVFKRFLWRLTMREASTFKCFWCDKSIILRLLFIIIFHFLIPLRWIFCIFLCVCNTNPYIFKPINSIS